MKKYDITALGEILIDFTSAGVSEIGSSLFEQNPGGAPANVLAAVSKLGGKSAFIGKVGDDMHGRFLADVLKENNISTDGLIFDKDYFTTLAFVNLSPNGERTFSFARKPGADTQITKDDVKYDIIKESKVFHIGSLSFTDEPARSASFAALEFAKSNGITISYDPNYRKMLWKDEKTAISRMRTILDYVNIIKISDEEIPLLTDSNTPEDASEELLNRGIDCVIITLGSKGALVRIKDGYIISKCPETKVVDTTGAGDSFMGGFLYRMTKDNKKPCYLTLDKVKEYAEFANIVGTICVSRRGAIKAMPSLEEVKNFK
ncbi:MAG: carbohydrate kinase [Clostridia bacterium]|nr:carbohydrate kinase [Clostridia bacterium]